MDSNQPLQELTPTNATATTSLSDGENSPSSAVSFLSMSRRAIVSLPEPVLTLIVSYLPSSTVTALSLVNHEWLTVTREQWLWKQWFVANYPHCWHQRVSTAASSLPDPQTPSNSALYDPETEEAESIASAMSMDCANDGIDWRREYQARSQIRSWSKSLFTPPRRRHSNSGKMPSQPFYFTANQDENNTTSANNASTALSSSPSSTVSFAPIPSSSSPKSASTSLFASPSQPSTAARTHPSPDHASISPSSSYNHLRNNNNGNIHAAHSSNAPSMIGGIPRSKSASWSEERKLLQQMKHEREKYEVGELESIQGNNYAPLPPQRTHNGTHFNSHLRPMKSSFGSNGDKKSRVSKSGQTSKENKKMEKGNASNGNSNSSSVPPPFPTTPIKQGHSGKSPYLSPKMPSSSLTASISMEDLSLGDAISMSAGGAEANVTSSAAPLLLTGHRSAVTCVRLDETRAAVACGQSVRVHSLENGSLLEHVKVCQHGIVTSVDFSSRLLVASGSDCTIRSFDLDSFECERISAKKQNHQDVVTAITIAANERAMLSISLDASLKLWDLESGNCSSTVNQGDRAKLGMLLCMDSLSDSELIVGGSYQNNARVSLFDVRAGSVLSSLTMDAKTTQTNYGPSPATQMTCSISYSAANFTVAAGGNDGTVRVFDIRQMSNKQQLTPLLHVNVPPFQNYQHHHSTTVAANAPISGVPISRFSSNRAASPLTVVSSSPPVDSYIPLRPASHHSPPPRNNSPGLAHLYPASYNPHQVALGPPVQSLHLDSNRLLLCQKRVVSIFSSSATSPAVSNGLPFAHLIHRVTLDDVSKWYNSTSGPLQLFHYMSYQEKSGLLALATTDVVLVWNKGRLVY